MKKTLCALFALLAVACGVVFTGCSTPTLNEVALPVLGAGTLPVSGQQREYDKFTTDANSNVVMRTVWATTPLGAGTLPVSGQQREYDKFTTDANSNAAVRITVEGIVYPVQISWHLERPTNATYAIKWFDCASADITWDRLMGITEAGTVQGHIIGKSTNDAWGQYTTNLASFSISTNGTSFNSYTDFVDNVTEQWTWVGWIITNDVTGVTNLSCTLHGTR